MAFGIATLACVPSMHGSQSGGRVDMMIGIPVVSFFFHHFNDSIITDVAQPFVPSFKVRDHVSYVSMIHPDVLCSEQVEAFVDPLCIHDDFSSPA